MPLLKTISAWLMRIPVPWMFVLAYLLGVVFHVLAPLPSHFNLPIDPVVAGALLFLVGAVVAGWAWFIFRRAGTTRVPGELSTRLVTWGPYRMSRNPMYVGLAVAYLGEAGLLRQTWPVLLLPLVIVYLNWIVIPLEEQRLGDVFDVEYHRYRARVRRWL